MNTISLKEIGDSLMGNKGKLAQKTNISKKNPRIKQDIPCRIETQLILLDDKDSIMTLC